MRRTHYNICKTSNTVEFKVAQKLTMGVECLSF